MNTRIDLEVHEQLVKYLAGEQTLREFRTWFDASTWSIESVGVCQDVLDLAAEIELRLCEFASGHWTEAELRLKLLPLAQEITQRPVVVWTYEGTWLQASSSSVTQTMGVVLGLPVDTTLSVERV